MKKFVIQIVILLIIIFTALYFATSKSPNFSLNLSSPKMSQLQIGNTTINVLVADNDNTRKRGLGGKEAVATNEGMLFVYPNLDKRIFWMKGVKFPLDFIWIRGNQVVDIIKNVPGVTKDQKDEDLPRYTSKELVDKALEVAAGFVDSENIHVGDTIQIK